MEKLNDKYTDAELADSFVFRNTLTPEQQEQASVQLAEARKKLKGQLNEKQQLYAHVTQLRFLREGDAKFHK